MVRCTQSQTVDNHEKIGERRDIQRIDRNGEKKVDCELREEYSKEKNEKVGISGAIQ